MRKRINKLKIILTAVLLTAVATACFPQQHVFKFEAKSDMFFLKGNEAELERLHDFVEQNKPQITSGQMPVSVDGYCASSGSRADNLKTAKIRSNRVKSVMIAKNGLKEEHFVTANHAESYEGMKDIVTVSFNLKDLTGFKDLKDTKEEAQPVPKPETVLEQVEKEAVEQAKPAKTEPETTPVVASVSEAIRTEGKFSVRTNLLYWAVATPNLGLEWKPSNSIGFLVNGAYSHWIWSDESNHHRTWMISPEIRYYFGGRGKARLAPTGWFIGAEGHIGEFNFKFKDTGYQGDLWGAGLTGGYRLRLSSVFDMDFSLGIGYTSLKYESYYRSNSIMVRKESGLSKNVFAPTQLGVSLVWNLDL
jgi:hypothetical protein